MTTLTSHDPSYPALLRAVSTPPPLWLRGAFVPDDGLAIAIVGSRRATVYGLGVAGRLAADLASRGVTIVSGLARGIDTAAHRGALDGGGRTIAVLGSGIDVVYPPENRRLASEIERHGALVSQFRPGTPPLSRHFPARNRTLAALSLGVVVVEATERSGALITAGFAGDLGREVFAVPGKITSETSAGTHRLIQDGAKLIRDWADVVQELPEQWRRAVLAHSAPSGAGNQPADQTPEARVLALLDPDEPRHVDELISAGQGDASSVAAALVALELEGWARQLPGQRWVSLTGRRRPPVMEVGPMEAAAHGR
jgi:DNA processing protein